MMELQVIFLEEDKSMFCVREERDIWWPDGQIMTDMVSGLLKSMAPLQRETAA